jgi:hypothetical protein
MRASASSSPRGAVPPVQLRVLDRAAATWAAIASTSRPPPAKRDGRPRAHVEGAASFSRARNGDGEDRLVFVLVEVSGNALKRGSRCAFSAIDTLRLAAAEPVNPVPGRIRGVRVSSSTRGPMRSRAGRARTRVVVQVDEAGVGSSAAPPCSRPGRGPSSRSRVEFDSPRSSRSAVAYGQLGVGRPPHGYDYRVVRW